MNTTCSILIRNQVIRARHRIRIIDSICVSNAKDNERCSPPADQTGICSILVSSRSISIHFGFLDDARMNAFSLLPIEENGASMDDEEVYKQIRSPAEHVDSGMDLDLRLLLTHRSRLYLLLLLILTSQTHALPILASAHLDLGSSPSSSLSTANIQWSTTPSPTDPYRVYRHMPILLANLQPSYSNGGTVQVHSQRNFSQLRRERHRRAMIDRLLLAFDDDGQ